MTLSLFTHKAFDPVTQRCLGCGQHYADLQASVKWNDKTPAKPCADATNLTLLPRRGDDAQDQQY